MLSSIFVTLSTLLNLAVMAKGHQTDPAGKRHQIPCGNDLLGHTGACLMIALYLLLSSW